jgi:protein phosphatase
MAKATKTTIYIPGAALVVLVGIAGSGKSTFASERFRSTEILSSDRFRAMVSDDEGDQEATDDAFAILHSVLEKRLRRGRLCVVDATNLQAKHRAILMKASRSHKRPALAIVFDTPEDVCVTRADRRKGRPVSAAVIHEQAKKLAEQTDEQLLAEGFRKVVRIKAEQHVEIRRAISASA